MAMKADVTIYVEKIKDCYIGIALFTVTMIYLIVMV